METSQNKPKKMSAGNVQVKPKQKGYRKRNVFWLFAAKIEYKSLGTDEGSLKEEQGKAYNLLLFKIRFLSSSLLKRA